MFLLPKPLGSNKPNPKIFQWAMSSVNGKKEECIMIGDDFEVDILGSQKCRNGPGIF